MSEAKNHNSYTSRVFTFYLVPYIVACLRDQSTLQFNISMNSLGEVSPSVTMGRGFITIRLLQLAIRLLWRFWRSKMTGSNYDGIYFVCPSDISTLGVAWLRAGFQIIVIKNIIVYNNGIQLFFFDSLYGSAGPYINMPALWHLLESLLKLLTPRRC